jgi:hypothetical protein
MQLNGRTAQIADSMIEPLSIRGFEDKFRYDSG